MSGTAVKVIPKLSLVRTFAAARDPIFRAWIDSNELKKWFGGADKSRVQLVNLNPRNGARFRIGLKSEEGDLQLYGGVLIKVKFPDELMFTWARGAGGTQQSKTLVSVFFREKDGGTELSLTQEYFIDESERLQNENDWTSRLDNLQKLFC